MSHWKRPKKRSKKKFVIDKKTANIIHTKRRARKRYNVSLNNQDVKEIGKMIQYGNSIHLMKESNSRSHHLVKYKSRDMVIVYDEIRKVPITCLPKTTENLS